MGLSATGQFSIGSLVRVRERDWVVLPSDDPEILKLRPLSGSEAEACGILKALEGSDIRQAEFPEPNPDVTVNTGRQIGGSDSGSATLKSRSLSGFAMGLGRMKQGGYSLASIVQIMIVQSSLTCAGRLRIRSLEEPGFGEESVVCRDGFASSGLAGGFI